MKTKELKWDFEYELSEIRRTGISKLTDLDGFIDRITNFMHDSMAAIRAVYRAVRG